MYLPCNVRPSGILTLYVVAFPHAAEEVPFIGVDDSYQALARIPVYHSPTVRTTTSHPPHLTPWCVASTLNTAAAGGVSPHTSHPCSAEDWEQKSGFCDLCTQHSHAQPLDYPSQKEAQFIFMMSDKNRDGYLSWAEVHAADKTLTQAEFNMIDANKDRYITMQEYLGFISR